MNLVGGTGGWVIGGILAVLGGFALAALLIGWVVAPLAGTSPEERAGDCACGHPVEAHEHNRVGSDCSLCTACSSFRRPPILGRRRAGQTRPMALAPTEADIERMIRDYYKGGDHA